MHDYSCHCCSSPNGDSKPLCQEELAWQGTVLFWGTILCTVGFFILIGFILGRLTA